MPILNNPDDNQDAGTQNGDDGTASKKKENSQMAEEKIHVYPINDLAPHNTDSDICPCNPKIDDRIVIHNSYDGRETGECCVKS